MKPIEILLVEDNPGDARLIKEVLESSNLLYKLTVVSDGIEAMAFLQRLNQYVDSQRPDLILLDWNLPNKNGLEVLDEIKNDVNLRSIPVLFLTSSEEIRISNAHHPLADAYISKPMELNDFKLMIDAIHKLGFNTSRLDK